MARSVNPEDVPHGEGVEGAVCKDMPNGCQCVERSPAHSMRPGVEAIRRQMAIRSVVLS